MSIFFSFFLKHLTLNKNERQIVTGDELWFVSIDQKQHVDRKEKGKVKNKKLCKKKFANN